MVRGRKPQDASERVSRGAKEVTDAHEERARVRGHVFDVGRQEVFTKKGVFRVAWDGLDEVLLVFG